MSTSRRALWACLLLPAFTHAVRSEPIAPLHTADALKVLHTEPLAVDRDPPAAEGNGIVIRDSQVRAAYRVWSASGKPLDDAGYAGTLDRLIDQKVSAAAARNEGLHDDPDVRQRMELAADAVLGDEYLLRKLRAAAAPDRLQAAYQAYLQQHPPREEVRIEQIAFTDAAKAAQAQALLASGADFTRASRLYGNPEAPEGLGTVAVERLPSAVADAVGALPVGGVSAPVSTPFGVYMYRVAERRSLPAPSFEETAPQLQTKLATQALEETVRTLREGYAVHPITRTAAK